MVFGYAFTKYHLILSLRVQHFETYKSYKYLKFAFENVSRTTPRVIFRSSANRKSGENMRHFWWLSSIVAGTDAERVGMSENGVCAQWNSHLVGIMISKTIVCRGTLIFGQTHIASNMGISSRPTDCAIYALRGRPSAPNSSFLPDAGLWKSSGFQLMTGSWISSKYWMSQEATW